MDITFCTSEKNQCKRRNSCFRYTCEHGENDYVWWADFWREYGKDCKNFIQDTTSKKQEIHRMDKTTTLPDLPEDSK